MRSDTNNVVVLKMLDAYKFIPCTWGRKHDRDEICDARNVLEELIQAAFEVDCRGSDEKGWPEARERMHNALKNVMGDA